MSVVFIVAGMEWTSYWNGIEQFISLIVLRYWKILNANTLRGEPVAMQSSGIDGHDSIPH